MNICMFCQEPLSKGNRAKEHILSKDLLAEFTLSKVILQHSDLSIISKNFSGGHISIQEVQRSPTYSGFIAGKVCAKCNNGWMNQLEQETRPLLYPLIRGDTEVSNLHAHEKEILSIWAFKTASTLSQSTGAVQFNIPLQHSRQLYIDDAVCLPQNTAVFAYSAQTNDFLWSLCPTWSVQIEDEIDSIALPSQHEHAYKIFLQLGRLMIAVCHWPNAKATYTFEQWGIEPIDINGSYLDIDEDCRPFFQEESLQFMMALGVHLAPQGEIQKVGRNTPCPCGSRKKFKLCHGA